MISIAYTHTLPDQRIDAIAVDTFAATRGYFGAQFHYVVKIDGVVEIARDPRSRVASHRLALTGDTIFIGVVGGRNEDGERIASQSDAQRTAVAELTQALADCLQKPLDVDDLTVDHDASVHRREERLSEEQTQRLNDDDHVLQDEEDRELEESLEAYERLPD